MRIFAGHELLFPTFQSCSTVSIFTLKTYDPLLCYSKAICSTQLNVKFKKAPSQVNSRLLRGIHTLAFNNNGNNEGKNRVSTFYRKYLKYVGVMSVISFSIGVYGIAEGILRYLANRNVQRYWKTSSGKILQSKLLYVPRGAKIQVDSNQCNVDSFSKVCYNWSNPISAYFRAPGIFLLLDYSYTVDNDCSHTADDNEHIKTLYNGFEYVRLTRDFLKDNAFVNRKPNCDSICLGNSSLPEKVRRIWSRYRYGANIKIRYNPLTPRESMPIITDIETVGGIDDSVESVYSEHRPKISQHTVEATATQNKLQTTRSRLNDDSSDDDKARLLFSSICIITDDDTPQEDISSSDVPFAGVHTDPEQAVSTGNSQYKVVEYNYQNDVPPLLLSLFGLSIITLSAGRVYLNILLSSLKSGRL